MELSSSPMRNSPGYAPLQNYDVNSSDLFSSEVDYTKPTTEGDIYANDQVCHYSDCENNNVYLLSSEADFQKWQDIPKAVSPPYDSEVEPELHSEEQQWPNYVDNSISGTSESLSAAYPGVTQPVNLNDTYVPPLVDDNYGFVSGTQPQEDEVKDEYSHGCGNMYVSPESSFHECKFSPQQLPLLRESDSDGLNRFVELKLGLKHNYEHGLKHNPRSHYKGQQHELEYPSESFPAPQYQIKVIPNLFTKVGASLSAGGIDLVFHQAYGICRRDQFPSSELMHIPAFFNTDVPVTGKTCEQTMFEEQNNSHQILTRFTQTKYGTCRILPKPKYTRRIKDKTDGKFLSLDFRQKPGRYFTHK